MHPLRRQRLMIVLFIVMAAGLAVALLGYALRQNINLFYPPSAIAAGEAPVGRDIRAGGMVLEGSIQRAADSLDVSFIVTDYQANVPVTYTGILPDLFSEGEGVVVAGQLDDQGVFRASQVLAKHDENYMPPEVSDALEKARPEG
ncbi:MAG TPA: cytochrome c maturation protein CcmE [Spongiibacteraceae bacterium]|nr:cytochrome c maturation protein CcmE [Spongiibacteraceae bacterium]HCS28709.1 cytochrome c maturation protein CcmE [Spongiibacteraceae bacterium]|tara:strand:- start:1706 stop:2140 length:435 start_codon:yes stop_codon:yes gene_type:complete